MGGLFFDTSALVKRYHIEPGSDIVDALFADPESRAIVSRVGLIEATSAFAMKVRSLDLSESGYTVARKKLAGDVVQGTIRIVRLGLAHLRDAETLIDRYAKSTRLRTLDALQLSVARDLHAKGRIDKFICADMSLCAVASLEDVPTLNPLSGS